MPCFRVQQPGTVGGARAARSYRLNQPLITIGRGADNDIILSDPQVADSHAIVQCEGDEVHVSAVEGAELSVNGKRRRRHRLATGDALRLGQTDIEVISEDAAQHPSGASSAGAAALGESEALVPYRKLYEFSARLLANYEIAPLLDALMDAVIEVSGADRGFLVLLSGDAGRAPAADPAAGATAALKAGPGGPPARLSIQVARNTRKETLVDPDGQLSDSIIEKVLRTRKPLIVSDALADQEFKHAQSVLNLRLSSVMCVPLQEHGQMLGVIYVGSSSVRKLFAQSNLELLTVFAAQASLLIRNALLVNELQLDKRLLTEELDRLRFGSLLGSCPAMVEIFRKVARVATTDVSVLITGETGTGKELIAQEIHRRSPRGRGPLVTINCGAIPEQLLESELFGHVKGAFTGAVQNKLGRLQAASGGTVFLDEIGEMALPLQVKLLRVLQERVIVRVGETRPEPIDVRVLTATHRDLQAEIRAGRFREDLYYRLNVVQLHLPPLRERGDDVLLIAKHLLLRYAKEFGGAARGFSPSAAIAIRKCPWPGNIRQLENHIKKAIVLSDLALLTPEDLGLSEDALPKILPLADAKDKFQREYINEVLALNNGNRTKTARDLGVDPRTIFRHLEKEDEPVEP